MSQLTKQTGKACQVRQHIRTLATVELQHVLTFLKVVELLRVSRVSRGWYSAVDSPLVWRYLEPRDREPDPANLTSMELLRSDLFTSAECRSLCDRARPLVNPWFGEQPDTCSLGAFRGHVRSLTRHAFDDSRM
jgi:hypothetical protein